MRAKLGFDAYGLSLALLALGCGGGGSSNTPAASGGTSAGGASSSAGSGAGASGGAPDSEASRFIADYATEVCAMYQPCCERDGRGFEASGCATWFRKVTAAYFKGEYDEARGAACLRAIKEARAADANRCTTVPLFDEATLRDACAEAFTSSARAGEPLGGKCLLAADCASSAGENVICSSGSCLLERRGAAGDGPCYVSGMRVNETARCNAKDGLYCDRSANVCAPRVGPGELCPYPGACDDTALCVGGICQRLPDLGEPCLNGVPGAGGYCRAGTVCDRTALTCGPGLDAGAACRSTGECAHGLCDNGVCVSSDFEKNLNCTG